MSTTQPITYQQLLAEVFDENARNQLVDAQEYEEEDVDAYDVDKYSENEIEDGEEFNKFQGDMNKPENVIKVEATTGGGTTTYGYNKDIRTTVVNIDGKFRNTSSVLPARATYTQCASGAGAATAFGGTSATEFLVGLARQYKNVTSVKIITMEFENSFYTFSGLKTQSDGIVTGRENTSFIFTYVNNATNSTTVIDSVSLYPGSNSISLTWNDSGAASRTITVATVAAPNTIIKTITDSGSDLQYWTFPTLPYRNPYTVTVSNLSVDGPYIVTLTAGSPPNTSKAVAANIVIPDGNYALTGTNGLIPTISSAITAAISSGLPSGWNLTNFSITQDPYSLKLSFNWDHLFELQFPTTTDCFTKNGIGYNLGYYNTLITLTDKYITFNSATGIYSAVADTRPDLTPDRYVFLVINDWYQVHHQYPDQTQLSAFLKVPLNTAKYQVQYDNVALDTNTKEYFFPQPVNIQKLDISMVDVYGKVLDMNGGSFSMSLAINEVLQPGIYENLLKL